MWLSCSLLCPTSLLTVCWVQLCSVAAGAQAQEALCHVIEREGKAIEAEASSALRGYFDTLSQVCAHVQCSLPRLDS